MKLRLLLYNLLIIIFFTFLSGCSSDADIDNGPDAPPSGATEQPDRAVLVYMVANNNLIGYAHSDLDEMRTVAAQACKNHKGRWIVYFSGTDRRPRLIEFDTDGNEVILKQYDNSQSSASIDRMQAVISDFRDIADAKSYGLVLWSHGTGWIDDGGTITESPERNAISPQSFADDGGARMKLTSLERALRPFSFDYIYFDCCHMATVEVAYQLRHIARLMVASPTELGVEGMPYDLNIPLLIQGGQANIQKALNNTFDFYQLHFNKYAEADSYSIFGCCISLIDLSTLDDLAKATKRIYNSGARLPDDYSPIRYYRQGVTEGIYDMDHYMSALTTDAPLLYASWRAAFDKAVVMSLTTSKVYMLPAEHFAGLGSFVPRNASDLNTSGFTDSQWFTDVVSNADLP
ncbi:MAG: clostripain-related cysteine peptidase [Bacteroides sp.]|nr:clostripain-related cysteine peptidase [Bacteroides sp.]MCM1413663.1 clostripain-related cysteine peptidase [Bacteroides sp.]MCM1471842.1 clostripain-related cysteine peptidase [Bacteroides sp.]